MGVIDCVAFDNILTVTSAPNTVNHDGIESGLIKGIVADYHILRVAPPIGEDASTADMGAAYDDPEVLTVEDC